MGIDHIPTQDHNHRNPIFPFPGITAPQKQPAKLEHIQAHHPTYISQYLGYSVEVSATIFAGATLAISMTTFIAIFVYERLNRNMNLTILLAFTSATVAFLLVYFVKNPALNIVFLVVAIMSSNSAATMMWSRYCPGLRDTGMVSSATGFLDFVSYMAAAVSSTIFANAVTSIGWENIILVWFALMMFGVIISLPQKNMVRTIISMLLME